MRTQSIMVLLLSGISALVICPSQATSEEIIYDHAFDPNYLEFYGIFSNTPSPPSSPTALEAADDFSLLNESIITGVRWWGYFGSDLPASVNALKFRIAVFADDRGSPLNDPIYTHEVTAQVRDTGLRFTNTKSPFYLGRIIYEFDADSI